MLNRSVAWIYFTNLIGEFAERNHAITITIRLCNNLDTYTNLINLHNHDSI